MNSSELKGFLTGLIYGDGHIDSGVTKRAFRIKTIHKEYAYNIKEELESCTNFQIKIKEFPERKSHGCVHKKYWELSIASHPYFAKKYHHFYGDAKERIASKESLSWITPMGLAYWYMSDGYICLVGKTSGIIKDRRVDICTDRYPKKIVEKMINILKNKFDLNCSIIKRNNSYRIRIKSDSYLKFYDIIYPYMINCMKYKLYFGYDKQPRWMPENMWKLQNDLKSAITLTDNAEG